MCHASIALDIALITAHPRPFTNACRLEKTYVRSIPSPPLPLLLSLSSSPSPPLSPAQTRTAVA